MNTTHDAKIKGITIWFYIIAAFQVVAAFLAWSTGAADPTLAVGATALVGLDLLIGALFVAFGYFAGKRRPWAFVAGIVLYAVRTALQLAFAFNPIVLIIRAFLIFRIWQGLQSCLASNRASAAMALINRRRLEMPSLSPEPATPPAAWVPSRAAAPEASPAE